jgi:diguanylate cyclase
MIFRGQLIERADPPGIEEQRAGPLPCRRIPFGPRETVRLRVLQAKQILTHSSSGSVPHLRKTRMHNIHALGSRVWRSLPRGGNLPLAIWQRRHRGIVVLLWLHALGIPLFGLGAGAETIHALTEGAVVAVAAVIAGQREWPRGVRSTAAVLGLLSSSGILVHLSGGLIEMHFHFFVMVAVVTLYQDWLPFLLAIGYVVAHHGLMGWLEPTSVYNHPDALAYPWKWAAIHGAFIMAESVALLTSWRLSEEGFQDSLTDLANRALITDRIQHALARGSRLGRTDAVLFMDLDGFKTINDSLGHGVGDELLVAVADRLRTCLRGSDTAARLGGDEFAILLEGTDERGAVFAAERVLDSLQAPFILQGKEVFVTASIGIAANTKGREDADELLRNADAAMYAAKSKGKARCELFAIDMHTTVLRRLELQNELQRAVRNQEFTIQYQPIMELKTGGIAKVEALVRWEHPSRGLVPPMDFIPAAEETGLIVDIGRFVLEQACSQVQQWQVQHQGGRALEVGVNVSARQLQDSALAHDVAAALERSGLDPQNLTLEITESVLMEDVEASIDRLQELKALGVKLAIDDFGTGYSSLSYLQQFPVDVLKIDRTFVKVIDGAKEDSALVSAIVKLGHTFGLQLVAEGVETAEQLAALTAMSCDRAQGYLFARPLWASEMGSFLARGDARRAAAG